MARRTSLSSGWRRYAVVLSVLAMPFTVAACAEEEPADDEIVEEEQLEEEPVE